MSAAFTAKFAVSSTCKETYAVQVKKPDFVPDASLQMNPVKFDLALNDTVIVNAAIGGNIFAGIIPVYVEGKAKTATGPDQVLALGELEIRPDDIGANGSNACIGIVEKTS